MKTKSKQNLQEVIKKYFKIPESEELNKSANKATEMLVQYFQVLNDISKKQSVNIK